MSKYNNIPSKGTKVLQDASLNTTITMGRVMDTNDPHQMGRLRVMCPAFGDSKDAPVSSLAWAVYASPFAGSTEIPTRGRSDNKSVGPVAYGMWNIPKVGSTVLIGCIDGNPNQRFWFAAIYPDFSPHTMPHGRFSYNIPGQEGLQGPLTSTESPLDPLALNQIEAFTNAQVSVNAQQSYEWKTRIADGQVAFVNSKFLGRPDECDISKVGDDRNVSHEEPDGNTLIHSQGYQKSRIDPSLQNPITDGTNWDPQTYAWVSPGQHAISMNDSPLTCRTRLRTVGGHQIILDDTNERIYISTAQGKTWIEIDEKGTIDIFSEQDFSLRSKGDINFKTDKSFRVTADEGIHLKAGEEIRLHSQGEFNIKSNQAIRMRSLREIKIEAQSNLHILAAGSNRITAGGTLNLSAEANMLLSSSADIHLNGAPAMLATQSNVKEAFVISRMPDHEPFARTYTKSSTGDQDNNNIIEPEYSYDDPNVGKGSKERGISFNRNARWHR